MELNITHLMTDPEEMMEFSASAAEIGQDAGRITWNNRVTNTAEARRMLGRWADRLRSFLDSHYTK